MLNLVALALLATSLAAAGVWSPSPEPPHRHLRRDELLLEGHRFIIVEYERRVPVGEPKEEPPHHSAAKDKICDAYGVCRDKLSTLFGKTKDKLSEAEDFAEGKAAEVKEGAEVAITEAKDKAAKLKEGAGDAAKSARESAADALRDAVGAAEEKGRDAAARAVPHAARTSLSDVARRAREVAFAWAPPPGAGRAAAGVAHLVAAAAAYGTCAWVTFVSSHVLAAALPRQLFGVVQSKLYPVYFRALAYCVGAALLAQLLGRDRRAAAERVQSYNLLGVLALVLVNMLFLEPKATKAMFERMKLEKEEGRGRDVADMVVEPASTAGSPATAAAAAAAAATSAAVPRNVAKGTMADPEMMKSRIAKLNKRLKRLNNYSSTLNIVTMMGLSWHLVHLARQLQKQC